MAEHEEPSEAEQIEVKPRDSPSSLEFDSGTEEERPEPSASAEKAKVFRLFGREKPVHHVLGGGQAANLILWRDKKISAGILVDATAIWVMFEFVGYHLLPLISHGLIISLLMLFLWSKALTFINKSPPHIPEVRIPEDQTVRVALAVRNEINRAFAVLREIALGRGLKKFIIVIAGLYLLSIVGTSLNFLTLLYLLFLALHTVPVLYEKYEDKLDAYAEKGMFELKKRYALFDAKVMSKIPRLPLKEKKMH
ncbi:reticulon-like protein B6 [Zingiber officinale]|uniref:reticulon-like protein B6 n=1 Tax=Zingiber officinale TaxID=94328 RepID=UPI001C4C37A5|nr:reticulon-like protein B6 [Zingiber officinale]